MADLEKILPKELLESRYDCIYNTVIELLGDAYRDIHCEYAPGQHSLVFVAKMSSNVGSVTYTIMFKGAQIPVGLRTVNGQDMPIVFTGDSFAITWFVNNVCKTNYSLQEKAYVPKNFKWKHQERFQQCSISPI